MKLVQEYQGLPSPDVPSGKLKKFIWMFFGNVKDGYIGDSNWNPEQKDTVWIRIKWWFRNPAHNFTHYSVGIGFIDEKSRRVDENSQEIRGWNNAYSYRYSNGKKYKFKHYLGKSWELYFGWRGRGNFGLKAKRVRK